MALIYKAYDIEQAIRLMHTRNGSSIVFQHSFTRRSIRERLDLVADINSILVRPWDSIADRNISRWKKEKGLMYYRHYQKVDKLPECDAVLFTCCPLNQKQLDQFANRVKKEIILYCPPDWSMHDETIDFKFPMSDKYKLLIGSLKKVDRVRGPIQCLAVEYAKIENCYSFTEDEMQYVSGLKKGELKKLLDGKFFMRGHYHRYDVYRPVIAPKSPELLEMYELLTSEDDAGGGLRMLRFGKLKTGYFKFFQKALKIMIKQGCVIVHDSVHIISHGFEEPDYEIQDAVSNVKRDQCLKFRSMIEAAPDYFQVDDTQSLLRSELSLSSGQILGTVDSIQQESAADQS